MRLERSKNALRNSAFGMASKIVAIVMPFICRTVFIKTLGAEYLGLSSMFRSILTMLSLTELGFGSAIVFSMYKPIANDDKETIDALLLFYRKAYRIIGVVILVIGLSLMPFIGHFIHGSYPQDINVYLVYLIFLLNTVVSYFAFAYMGALVSAFQREDLMSKVCIFINFATNLIQIILLLTVRNYYAYILVLPVFTIINNIYTAWVAKQYFPQYKPQGKLDKENKAVIKEKVSGLVISNICGVSRNALDSIFVSMFIGLTDTAIYNNYYYIMNSIVGFMAVLTNSVIAGAGNSIVMDTVEKNYKDMNRMNFIYMWVSGWFTISMLCLYQPFMKIWVGDQMMLPMLSVILFCVYFYILKMGDIRSIYVKAKGIWWENRYRAIAEAAANIVLNYFLGKHFGINGIIAATLISLFLINFCYGSQLIFKYYFTEQKLSEYFLYHGKYALVSAVICAVVFLACRYIPDGYIGFIARIAISAILPNIMYYLIYRKTKMFAESMEWMLPRLRITKELGIKLKNKTKE